MRISWHPRGEIIATGSADCTAALWRLAGSEEGPDCGIKDVTRYPDATGLLAGHPEEVYACEVRPARLPDLLQAVLDTRTALFDLQAAPTEPSRHI